MKPIDALVLALIVTYVLWFWNDFKVWKDTRMDIIKTGDGRRVARCPLCPGTYGPASLVEVRAWIKRHTCHTDEEGA